jgi:hypothetical protein
MQGVAAGVFGAIFGTKEYKDGLKHLEGEQVQVITKEGRADVLPEFPLGTRRVTADGRVFRYCKHVEDPGQIVYLAGGFGVTAENGWVQTYGPCEVQLSDRVHANCNLYLERP